MSTSSPAPATSSVPPRSRAAVPAPPLAGETFGASAVRPAGSRTSTVVVRGDVDRETSPALLACLLGQLQQRAAEALVVDLRAATFLDAAGLRALLAARQSAGELGVPFRVRCRDRRAVRRPLELAGLLDEVCEES